MKNLLKNPTVLYSVKFVLLAAVYAATCYLSFYLVPEGGSGASLMWPPAAVGLVALYLFGIDLWPALLVPFFFLLLTKGVAAPTATGLALANTVESIFGAYLLTVMGFRPYFNRLGDTFRFILATVVSVALSASLIAGTLFVVGSAAGTLNTPLWIAIWIGHVVSMVSFGPFLLRWFSEPRFTLSAREATEMLVVIAIVAISTYLTGWTTFTSVGNIAFFYLIMIGLIWASLRTGTRGTTAALMFFALILSTGVLFGWGANSHSVNPAQTLFGIQVFTGVFSMIFLLFATVSEERRVAVKRLEEHVGHLEVSLEKISIEDQAKTDFIAILAHELRNPLSPILSSIELMKQNGIKPENERHVGSIASNVHIMARLLDDLLDISRITQKKFKIQLESVELSTILKQALEIAQPYIAARKHRLEVSLPQQPVWLSADSVRLMQAFVNILNNAAKYTDPGGTITLTTKTDGARTVVRITDNGSGIEPLRLSKIFDSFGGADGPSRKPGGLHIGLALSKRMVELHHGTIEPRSAGVGQGSEFIVTLPILATAPLPIETSQRTYRSRFDKEEIERLVNKDKESLRVLIVDDNEAAAKSLAELLQKNGRETALAFTGLEGIEQVYEQKPHVVLLDIGLPDIDGYEVAKRIRASYQGDIRLIALTGYGQPEDRQKARDAGFDGHIVKPVAIVDLERTISELVH